MGGCLMQARTIAAAAALLLTVSSRPAAGAQKASGQARSAHVDASRRLEDVNHRNADGSTPLQWAVYAGDSAEVTRLLRAGADVSIANNYGATPMSLAAEEGNAEI